MKQESIQAYTRKVVQASRSQLVVIMYEIVLEDVRDAVEAFHGNCIKDFKSSVKHAQKFVGELMASLDYQYAISKELMPLYIYVNRCLIQSVISEKPVDLESVEKVMNTLLVGFQKVSEEDTSGPVMENTQQVFAGLTYGRSSLNETYLTAEGYSTRGFKA